MGQRLMKTRKPIGITTKGIPVFAILGAEPDEEEEPKGDESGEGGGDGSEGQNTGKEEGDGSGESGGEAKTYTAEEYAALQARMKAADQNASKAQEALKKIEDAKKDDLTKATEKAEALEKTVSEKDATIADLRFANAFLTDNSVIWHDPALALSQARNRPEVTIEDDGTIKGLAAAVKALAKEKPFMVKDSKDDGETPPRSGSNTGSNGSSKPPKKDEAALRRKYAALNV